MKIENFTYGQTHITSENDTLRIEADVNINNGKAADINSGHVYRVEDEVTTPVDDFSNYPGANHRTLYGEPTIDEQIALMTAIDDFCTEVNAKDYCITAE